MSVRAVFSALFFLLSICTVSCADDGYSRIVRYRCEHFLLGSLGELTLEILPLTEGRMELLDGNRQQRYVSILRSDPERHIVPLSYQQLTHLDSHGRRIHYGWTLTFDGDRVTANRMWGGVVVESHTGNIPAGVYGDFLSILFAFQTQSEPLTLAEVTRYSLFTPQGIGRIVVTVEAYEQPSHMWRCRITSPGGRLPGGYAALTAWCDADRRIVKAEAPFLWGLGTVTVRKISESL